MSWLFTSKPSRLVDLGSSCCFTSYGALLRRRYFALRNKRNRQNRVSKTAPSNFLLLNLYKPAHCGGLCKIQNPSNFRGKLLPPKEP